MAIEDTYPELKDDIILMALEFLKDNLDIEVGAMVLHEHEISEHRLYEVGQYLTRVWREEVNRKRKEFYLENNGVFCPFCRSDNIESMGISADGAQADASIRCNTCSRDWLDLYSLTDVNLGSYTT
jgi:formate dehydrogenase maturation protein FdhE